MFRGASTSAANDNGVDEHRQENPDISTGPVHVNVGPGGAPGNNSGWRHYPWVAKTAQPEWSPGGYLKVRADSVCGLKIQYAGLDGDIQDEFALSKVPTEPPIELDIDLITWGDLAWDVWDKLVCHVPDQLALTRACMHMHACTAAAATDTDTNNDAIACWILHCGAYMARLFSIRLDARVQQV